MSVELVASAIAGNRSVQTAGPAETFALIISSLALKNPAALTRLVAVVLGEEPLDGKTLNPKPIDLFLAGIALGRAAGFPAAKAKKTQGYKNSREIREAAEAATERLQAEGKTYNKTTIISLVAEQLNVGKRTVERALSEKDPF